MKKRLFVLLLTALLALTACPAPAEGAEGAEGAEDAPAWAAYNGKRIGVLTGPLMEDAAREFFPDSEYLLFNSYPDCITALLTGKVDAYLGDEAGLKSVHAEQPEIDYIHERMTENNYSFAFRKGDPESAALCGELNAFLAQCWADGTMQELDDIWFGADEARKTVDRSDLTGANGTIRVVTTSTDAPFSYIKDGQNVGYDIDLVVRFCRWAGYQLELGDVDFAARIPAVQSGKYDFTTDMNVTPEREEQVLFSDPTSKGGIVLAILSGSGPATADAEGPADEPEGLQPEYSALSQLNGRRAGVITGAFHDSVVAAEFPDAVISNYNTYADLVTALKTDKIDFFLASTEVVTHLLEADSGIAAMADPVRVLDIGAMFARTVRGDALRAQMDDFIEQLKADGTLDEIYRFWSDPANESTPVDQSGLTGENGTLHFATSGTKVPISFVAEGQIAGTDPDIAVRFCRAYGYGIEVSMVDTAGIIPGIVTGMYDFSLSDMVITEERKESVNFSIPYHGTELLAVTRSAAPAAAASAGESGWWAQIKDSFHKTFLRESRWKLFLEGIGTTLLITLLTILFGTALGFAVFMLCRNGNAIANGITRFCVWLVTGTPMVVLLMILYYIVFGKVAVSGITVAIIGFTLTFGAAVFGLLKMGVGTIDRGQYEAAYALGHSNRHTFFKIILPQAIPHVLPAWQGEIVSLIKATAIVGYIAVQDLTRMGDIVRSRTYEAFFPLIAITVIYFMLEGLFSFAVGRIRISMDPKRRGRGRMLKGVELTADPGGGNIPGDESGRDGQTPMDAEPRGPVIKIAHLRKEYPGLTPLQDVSAEIHDGDVISIIGPSGTGKSTLLRCINQLEKPTSGRVWVHDTEITDRKCDISRVRQKMGMVFQSFHLFGHLTVIENIMLSPMDLLGKSRQEAYTEGMRLLRMVGLAEKALSYPDELSGGQMQRIAIARTLAMDPEVILLDEPTSALDPTMVGEVQAVIRELARMGKTMMIVTHEMNFARAISNRVFYMDGGGVYEEGTPEQIFDHPRRENTRRFVQRLKVLELNIESRDDDFLDMARQIEIYCSRNQIAPRTAARIQLAFEETAQLLLSRMENPRIQAVCEYEEVAESAEWTFRYGGECMDVTDTGDELALAVLEGITEEIQYARQPDAEMQNQLRVKIRHA